MRDLRPNRWVSLVLLGLVSCAVACTSTPSPNTNAAMPQLAPETVNGVQVLSVADGSVAMAGGLKPGDIIVAVGERDTPDLGALDAALTAQRASGGPFEVVIVRDRHLTSVQIAGDMTGARGRSWVGVLELALDMLARGDRDVATKALDVGAAEQRLTPAQALVGRLAIASRGTTPVDVAARTTLASQLAAASSPDDLKRMTNEYLLSRNHNEAAAAALGAYLERHPDDFSARLNMAVAQTYSGRYADADREVARVERDASGQLDSQGVQIVDQIRAWTALARKDYPGAAARFEAMLERQPPTTDYSTLIRYLYALARMRETEKLAAGLERIKAASAQLPGLTYQAQLIEAFALSEQSRRDQAVAITAGAEPVLPQPVIDFWKATPGGDDVISTWNQLRASSR